MPKSESSRKASSSSNQFSLASSLGEDPEQTPERYARDLKVLARNKERERRMQPYAKSTQRRQKRKEKSALKADLGEVEEALDEMGVDQFPGDNAPGETGSTGEQAAQGPKQQKGARLTQAKRKKELEQAKTRLPLLLKHEQFKANPFAAIREHAQNTMNTA